MRIRGSRGVVIVTVLATLSYSCASYKLARGGKGKNKVDDIQGFSETDPGGQERPDGNSTVYESLDGSLTLRASPSTTTPNGVIRFTAICFNNVAGTSVTWTFADGKTATGLDVSYSYQTIGSHVTRATCVNAQGNQRSGYVTVKVATSGVPYDPGRIPTQF